MTAPQIFTVPLVPMTRNQRDRAHWARRSKELGDWTLMLPMATFENHQGEDDPQRLIEIVFSKTRGPESDIDNLYGRCKVILDALQRRGWLYDDAPRYCALKPREETRAPQTQTTIAISEVVEVEAAA